VLRVVGELHKKVVLTSYRSIKCLLIICNDTKNETKRMVDMKF